MSSQEVPVFMETIARSIAKDVMTRFGAWLVSDTLTESQRSEALHEIFAHAVHDGIMTGYGSLHATATGDIGVPEALEMAAYVEGYSNAITDIDKGQGE